MRAAASITAHEIWRVPVALRQSVEGAEKPVQLKLFIAAICPLLPEAFNGLAGRTVSSPRFGSERRKN